MKHFIFAAVLTLTMNSSLALADAAAGKPAPDFSVVDATGKAHKLSDYKGQWLVLEWFNKDCPYVKKHYESQNMQGLQNAYQAKNVKWLTILSSAPGKQGHVTAKQALDDAGARKATPTAWLLDEKGEMGKAYGAKTTPHMFVINPEQVVVYAGAIDNNDSSNPKTIAKSTNYVKEALDAGMAGKAIKTSTSKPYGCGIKYQ